MVIRPPRQEELHILSHHMAAVDGLSHAAYIEKQARDGGIYLVAWDGDTPVGRLFVRWQNIEIPRIVDERPQAAQFADAPAICDVYVVPERRSEGVGAQLIQRAVECARQQGVSQVTICVDTDNPRARALYERLGFTESGIGVFTTSGTFVDEDGLERHWQNGPQVLLAQGLE